MYDELMHYGTPRHSGRYPWGSGENPYQHAGDFLSAYNKLKNEGKSEAEIVLAMGFNSTSDFRAERSRAKDAKRLEDSNKVRKLSDKGYSNLKIAEELGIPESTVRNYKKDITRERALKTQNTADVLRNAVDTKGYIDIGTGSQYDLGVSETKMKTAIDSLVKDGYNKYYIKVEQASNPGKYTTIKVLAPPDATYSEVAKNKDKITTITDYSEDGGETFRSVQYPSSLSSKRIAIRYGDEGGSEKDGVIELREGVSDISLGKSRYAQVRILVDGTHYMKGMAMYSKDLPDGVDVLFNTNKKSGTEMTDVLKEIKNDPDNPFGATIKANGQRYYEDENGNKKLSPINKIKEEGDWSDYSKTLSSQFLSKQQLTLINRQLNLSLADKQAEFDEICSYTNPTIKKKLLESFADDCDAAAVHLKAAPLSRQSNKVILPITTLKDNEIYAPDYSNGEKVVLIRYPHAGTFEIPELTVNNKQSDAKRLLGNAIDAVGINSKVAERLSGADFDGDTVVVIPANSSRTKTRVTTSAALSGLKNFDPKESYPEYPGMKLMGSRTKQMEMGKVSNLITDMTLQGATAEELTRAVKHSMVVIDAEKHHLDYKRSEEENGIKALREKYQNGGGANTLISKAKSELRVDERKDYTYNKNTIDPDTGEKIYTKTSRTYVDKTGKEVVAKEKSTKMAETKDAHTLSSGHPTEEAYADYANSLKALANQARKEMLKTEKIDYSPSAKATYESEVKSLNAKLETALKNAPRERQAQLIATTTVQAKRKSNPEMTNEDIKKAKSQALAAARIKVGAHKTKVDISDREWEAIQAGAISPTKLSKILNNCDMDKVKKRALPKTTNELSEAKQNRIKAYNLSGYTIEEIAEAVGCSTSTVSKYIKQ